MNASLLTPGMSVGARVVRQVVDTYETVWEGRVARGTRRVRAVTFTDGSTARYAPDQEVGADGYVEKLPGGPVRSKLANSATRVRAHSGRWEGESGRLGELRTWQHDQLVRMTGWDAASVNGRVGVTA